MHIFEILLINEIHTVDAEDAVCCVTTGQFLFVLFGQIPHCILVILKLLHFYFLMGQSLIIAQKVTVKKVYQDLFGMLYILGVFAVVSVR